MQLISSIIRIAAWHNTLQTSFATPSAPTSNRHASEIAAKIEFLRKKDEMVLKSGKIMNMSQLYAAYEKIAQENNVREKTCSRKAIKEHIQCDIEDVEFHKPKRANESERVSIKESRDNAIQLPESVNENSASNMKTLYNAALLHRKSIDKCESGSLDTLSKDNSVQKNSTASLDGLSKVRIPPFLLKKNALRYVNGPCIYLKVLCLRV